jgi:hypothetical protein
MKQVLLAINGQTPSKRAFWYAVELSKRIRAELSILRFIEKGILIKHLKATRKKAAHISRFLEDTFADAALAEEGITLDAEKVLADVSDPLKDLLAEGKADVALKLTVSGGDPEDGLDRFVESHHDVVLTILDSSKTAEPPEKNKARMEKLKHRLGVPLVVIKSDAT